MAIEDATTRAIIGCCIEVHRWLGPGLLESAYQRALAHELTLQGVGFEEQVCIPAVYKEVELAHEYRLDFVVESRVVVEIKAVLQLQIIHEAQLRTYLRTTGLPVGLLINFHVVSLRQGGIRRLSL
jgi:GxxExxY protein